MDLPIQGSINPSNPTNCAYLDDLLVWHYLPSNVQQTLLEAEINNSDPGPFSIHDPDGDDVHEQKNILGDEFLEIEDNSNASIYSDNINTLGVSMQDQLMIRYLWSEIVDLEKNEYCQAEYSLDGGNSYRLMSASFPFAEGVLN